jgi:hypothetical protein
LANLENGFPATVVVDSVGEWLASFLGITTPRYQYVLDDLVMQQREVRQNRVELVESRTTGGLPTTASHPANTASRALSFLTGSSRETGD